ncbi:hypothetical protein D9758_013932 [Tetrapyrgos nigripes]|uniref:Myb/SANT-like domain-containing protein n=1 Tax=Tetrapyrgos nigripes TaxID=182062 RepID=A0A8H5FM68_9AGAR|nr:hypothetical protein D9758_013932 [Tetrapyrgos nigripes]
MDEPGNKENQEPDTGAPDPVTPAPKKRGGRPRGSKNKPKDPSQPKTALRKKKTANDIPKTADKPRTPRPRAVYSAANDKTMVGELLEQKREGNNTDNGGWKGKAITAVVLTLAGSEVESGGAPKSDQSVRDHWDYLKSEFHIFKTLCDKSGWGWDEENQCVEASDEQWEALAQVDARLASYRGKSFPIYLEMQELLQGALATGVHAYHAGKDSDTTATSSSEDESEKDATPAPKKSLKRKASALADTPTPKLGRRERAGGRSSTSSSLMHMSHAMSDVASALKGDGDDLFKESKKRACELVRGEMGLALGDKAKLLLLISKDGDFAELLVNTDDVELRTEILKLKLQE